MNPRPWLTTLLTTAESLPPRESVMEAMNQIPGYETVHFQFVTEMPDRFIFRSPSATLAVSLADPEHEIPFETLKASCSRAWHWVEAAHEVSRATRQIVVAVLPEEDALEPLDVALLLTALTVAVLQNVSANAVFWNHSGMLHAPESFISHAMGMNRQAIPVELWIEFRLVLNSDLTLSIGTWGMKAFALAELEVSHSREDAKWLLRWLFNLAHNMLEKGPLDTKSEHTFGRSEKESFTLKYEQTAPELGRGVLEEVLRVEFESARN